MDFLFEIAKFNLMKLYKEEKLNKINEEDIELIIQKSVKIRMGNQKRA